MILNTKAQKVVSCIAEIIMVGFIVFVTDTLIKYATFKVATYWFGKHDMTIEMFLSVVYDGGFTSAVLITVIVALTNGLRFKTRQALLRKFA